MQNQNSEFTTVLVTAVIGVPTLEKSVNKQQCKLCSRKTHAYYSLYPTVLNKVVEGLNQGTPNNDKRGECNQRLMPIAAKIKTI